MQTDRKVAVLQMPLRGFRGPSTRTQVRGYLEAGRYIVEEVRNNHPGPDTDYARIAAPSLGAGDVWICTRWKQQRYAEITAATVEKTPRASFEDDPFAVPEAALIQRLDAFKDFRYDLDEARYPFRLPGVALPQAPPGYINCCTFVEALVVRAWADVHDGFRWSPRRHGQMMIFSNDDYFSPVTAVLKEQMAVAVSDPDTLPHPWTLVQGWRYQWRSGHTFLIVDHHPASDRVLTLESNSSYRVNGVGFRAIGNLRDQPDSAPPENWWELEELWTWQRICATYRYRQQARLKVKDRRWSRI